MKKYFDALARLVNSTKDYLGTPQAYRERNAYIAFMYSNLLYSLFNEDFGKVESNLRAFLEDIERVTALDFPLPLPVNVMDAVTTRMDELHRDASLHFIFHTEDSVLWNRTSAPVLIEQH